MHDKSLEKYQNSLKIAAKLPISNSFCHFKVVKKGDEIKKIPISATGETGIKISNSNAADNLMELAQIEDGQGNGDYPGIAFYSDMPLTPNGNVLVCLDVDTKRSKEKSELAAKIVKWAKNSGFLYERSFSGKGCHIFIAVEPGTKLPNKIPLEEGSEVEVFHSDYIKCLMLTGENISGEFIDSPINLAQEFAKIGLNINAPKLELPVEVVNQDTGEITTKQTGASELNQKALAAADKWIKDIFPQAISRGSEGWRISSESLGRNLEEDISIHPDGIVDFGVSDQGDDKEGKRTAVQLVAEHKFGDINEWQKASDWLKQKIGFNASKRSNQINTQDMELNKQGKILASFENISRALSQMPLAYDKFLETPMVREGNIPRRFVDADYVDLAILLEKSGFAALSLGNVKEAARKVFRDNEYDSAIHWANSLKWDGVERCDGLFSNYFGVPVDAYSMSVSLYFVTAMAGRLLQGGIQADMVPVLIGRQGAGKTRGVMALAPLEDTYSEIDLGNTRDADISRTMRGKLICELGELKGLKSRDKEWIKSWISRSFESWTPKYVEYETIMPRRCVFIGTSNEEQFLVDDTGNRRWLPLTVTGDCRVHLIKKDRDQIWAEAIYLFKKNGVMWEVATQLAPENHKKHMVIDDVMIEQVSHYLQLKSAVTHHSMKDICAGIGIQYPSRTDQLRVADSLRYLGWKKITTTVNKVDGKFWVVEKVDE